MIGSYTSATTSSLHFSPRLQQSLDISKHDDWLQIFYGWNMHEIVWVNNWLKIIFNLKWIHRARAVPCLSYSDSFCLGLCRDSVPPTMGPSPLGHHWHFQILSLYSLGCILNLKCFKIWNCLNVNMMPQVENSKSWIFASCIKSLKVLYKITLQWRFGAKIMRSIGNTMNF
jgi:hypothetical protein